MAHFESCFTVATNKIARLFACDDADNEVIEWYDPSKTDSYSIQGKSVIPEKLPLYNLVWSPLPKTLRLYAIMLSPGLEGKGIGTHINVITEELARDLCVRTIIMSHITNRRWLKTLLRQGFQNIMGTPDAVQKRL